MLPRRLYYSIKPYVPWHLRMAIRRISAKRKARNCRSTWPILEAAQQRPAGWPGWPEGKKFALLLTHDVEDRPGLAKCRALLELERKLGFRSSFNLIPEGPYRVTAEFRQELAEAGCEIGIHDLKHDGKLFHSHRGFQRSAERINRYVHDWGASGFRAGFMLRNLGWLHELAIHYDSSTFDTDPFEPQPDGASTIFPFWIPSPCRAQQNGDGAADEEFSSPAADSTPAPRPAIHRPGYVELPYTLPQDSTLFLVLQQKTADTWKRKLDWIVERGGMALLNVHPDYVGLNGTISDREYPVSLYTDFLQYVKERYGGAYWHPLPREASQWYRETVVMRPPAARPAPLRPAPPREFKRLERKRAAVLLYSTYPSDPRPRRAAEAMAAAGMEVDLLCLADPQLEPGARETIAGVNVYRVAHPHQRQSKWNYLWQYSRFFVTAAAFLGWRSLRRNYDVIHVHNMPDLLVFAAFLQKLRGSSVVLDLHDPMPELMRSIYGVPPDDWRVRLLLRLERWSIGFADLAFTPNISFRDLFVSRSCKPGKMHIVMNTPEESIFTPDGREAAARRQPDDGEFRVMHHGSIFHRHGVDLLVEAVALARAEIPRIRLDIFGAHDPFLNIVLATARRCGIADLVRYHGPKPQKEIAEAIRECHLGVVPNRRTPFTEINFPTRLFEYLALRRPVIAPATQGIRDYFGPDEMLTFEPDDVADLASRMVWVHRHPVETEGYIERGLAVYQRHPWAGERRRFLEHIATACTSR